MNNPLPPMSGSIHTAFQTAAGQPARKRLIAYAMAGDIATPSSIRDQARRCHDWVRAGVDILEIGVPFSDPMADGPAIQRAHARSLSNGTNIDRVFALIRAIRDDGCQAPVVLMTYFNPLIRYGLARVLRALRDYKVDGLLLVDCPGTERPGLYADLFEADIDPIVLVAPNTSAQRLARILPYARGFIYALSLKGVTGSALSDYTAVQQMVTRIRAQSPLPVALGFGIRHPEQVQALPADTDAIVVGSALAELTEHCQTRDCPEAVDLIRRFSSACRHESATAAV